MHWMLASLRWSLFEAEAGNSQLKVYQPLEWIEDGLRRRMVVCDLERLRIEHDVWAVGFFGERRPDRDCSPLDEVNADIVLEFRDYPGILSYSSMEFPNGNWANLVLHDPPETREQWRSSERHARAANELSPLYYTTVRIHNGFLPNGIIGSQPILITSTKYWDYSRGSVWRATRDLGQLPTRVTTTH